MKKNFVIILEVLVIFFASLYYIVFVVLPEYRENKGSSDSFIQVEKYKNMFELSIDENILFSLLINNDRHVFSILFFDKNSTCLYNQDIEGSNLEEALDKIMVLLLDNHYLSSQSTVVVTRYNNFSYDLFMRSLKNQLSVYDLEVSIIERESTLQEKALQLELDCGSSDEVILRHLDLYSKEFTRVSIDGNHSDNDYSYAQQVYRLLQDYVYLNQIQDLEKDAVEFSIMTIPADSNKEVYPNGNSWYYVKEYQVYAYIEFHSGNGYCFLGSVDLNKKGEC